MLEEDNILYTIRKTIPPIHSEGWRFIAIFAVVTAIVGLMSSTLLFIGIVLTVWCAYFFRDPIRAVPARSGLVLSPADGLVQKITQVIPPTELGLGQEERTRISIFLNVFDVHVNRVPMAGKVTALHYHPGAFLNASLDKASEENERQYATVTTEDGKTVGFVQIAGLIARRILCDLENGQVVKAGERFGIIRFGSRVDVYLPLGSQPLVCAGQRAVGGETVLADLQSAETARIATAI
ncbi:MAG TPA: phosphatidylserine decarboxylase [Rickettsiales bacterium]|nr:phosphatidylserine decarboxylase [Rickettsiales bacterium]